MAENQVIIDIEINSDEAKKKAEQLTGAIAAQRKKLAELRQTLKRGKGTTKEQREEWEKARKGVAGLERAIKENNTQLRQAQKEAVAENNSINALRASVSKLTKERNNLNTSTTEGKARFNELTASIRKQTDELKELEGAVGDNRRNVGNYKEGVLEALQANTLFSDTIGDLSSVIDGVSASTKSLRVALISLPFIAIAAALQAFFTQTEEGRKIIQKFGAIISGVFGKITQDIAKVGKFIFGLFDGSTSPMQLLEAAFTFVADQIINRLSAIGKAVMALARGDIKELGKSIVQFQTGLDADKLEKYADELARIARISDKINESQKKGRAAIRALNAESAKQARIAEENRKLRDDETLSFERRLEANAAVLKAEEARRDAQLKILDLENKVIEQNARQRADQAKERKKFNEEEKDAIFEIEARKAEILEDFAGRTTEQLTEQNAIIKEQLQARAELEAESLETRLLRQKASLEEELRVRLAILARQEEAEKVGLNEQNESFKLVTQKFLNERLRLRKEFEEKRRQQELESAKEQQAQQQANNAIEIQLVTDLETSKTQILLDEEVKRSEAKKKALEQDRQNAKTRAELEMQAIGVLAQTTGQFAQLLAQREDASRAAVFAQKSLALTEVALNLPVELSNIFSSNSIYPEPLGSIIKAAQAGLAIARAAENTKRITSVGFASGGYTGDGGRYEPAGIVHRGEFVVSKPQVARLGGASNVARITGQPMKGYANGGAVGLNMTSNVNRTRAMASLSSDLKSMQVQVAVTDIAKAQTRYNQIQTAVNQ